MNRIIYDTLTIRFGEQKVAMNDLPYHNMTHVSSCRLWARKNHEELQVPSPFEVPHYLELAITFHDAVYDTEGDLEFRSAKFMVDTVRSLNESSWSVSRDIEQAFVSIMATTDHDISNWPKYAEPMIKADLNDFLHPDRVELNWYRLKTEAEHLYGMGERNFAIANIKFLENFRKTMESNYEVSQDSFYEGVIRGIDQSIEMSEGVLKRG